MVVYDSFRLSAVRQVLISNLQLLRAFAALAVVLYHTNYPLIQNKNSDFQGVAVFFVISGFIMTYIILRDDRESSPVGFMTARIARIVPLYWLSVTALIMLSNLGALNLAGTIPEVIRLIRHDLIGFFKWLAGSLNFFSYYSPEQYFKTLFFIPYDDFPAINSIPHPILGVGWTLNMEMFFYLIFSLGMLLGKIMAPLVTAAFIIGSYAWGNSPETPKNFVISLYTNDYSIYFAAGIFVYYLWKLTTASSLISKHQRVFQVFSITLITLFAVANLFQSQTIAQVPRLWQIAPSLLVYGSLLAHSAGLRATNALCLLMGAASYSLYLTHTIVLELIRTVADKYLPILRFGISPLGFLFAAVLCSVVGVAVYLLVERPLLKASKKLLS